MPDGSSDTAPTEQRVSMVHQDYNEWSRAEFKRLTLKVRLFSGL